MPATVLVVEDDALIRQMVELVLRHHGLEVISAADAPSGLELARNGRPDLVLMDVQMPGMDGLEATRRLRGLPDLAQIPVVMLTGHVTQHIRDQARQAGCSAFLAKPVTAAEIMKTISKWVPLPQTTSPEV